MAACRDSRSLGGLACRPNSRIWYSMPGGRWGAISSNTVAQAMTKVREGSLGGVSAKFQSSNRIERAK
jgi:hypothetical protein